jgi:hypothetical protein
MVIRSSVYNNLYLYIVKHKMTPWKFIIDSIEFIFWTMINKSMIIIKNIILYDTNEYNLM